MRFLIAFLLGITLAYSGISQQNIYTSLKPAELVSESKSAGEKFNEISIFEYSADKKSVINHELRDYKALTLDVEQLQQLTNDAPAQLTFKIPSDKNNVIELELVKVNLFDGNFAVIESASNQPVNINRGVHYRGIIKGNPNSIAAVSIFEDEITGLISTDAIGNLVLARLNQKSNREAYVLYNDKDVIKRLDAYCDASDDGPTYTKEQLNYTDQDKTVGDCVRIYFEVDKDINDDKGGITGAANYITAIFNQSATLYANENVSLVISQIYVWNTTSPYSGTSSGTLLTQFQNYRTNFNGDLAQLVSYQASGGIAVLSGLCHPFNSARMSFASVGTTFASVPTYSFTVMVMTHELGHLLGSHHTHACVWNGNNTAIDGCAGFTEGSCGNPGNPSNGGTIMSYCHITSAGVNFNLGFGTQPGNVIRSMINSATCLQPCSNGGGNGGGGGNASTCEENELFLTIIIDDFGSENSWDLKNSGGTVLYTGGTFAKSSAGLIIRDTLCVPDGCYTFTMYDSYGDGMFCTYGEGSYSLKDVNGNVWLEGGEFTNEEIADFCAPFDTEGGGDGDCLVIDYENYNIDSYGGGQDNAGVYQLLDNNTVLKLSNNAWKSIALDYEVTANTVIEFEFRSTIEGEIHAIGFDDNATISYNRTIKVYGTQNWGIQDYNNYTGNGGWQSFSIPVGQLYQGIFDRLFFVADHDSGQHNGNSYYKNIIIKEGAGCTNGLEDNNDTGIIPENKTSINVFPNPAENTIQIEFSSSDNSNYNVTFFNTIGQEVKNLSVETTPGQNSAQIDVSQLPQGTYILKMGEGNRLQTKRLVITRE